MTNASDILRPRRLSRLRLAMVGGMLALALAAPAFAAGSAYLRVPDRAMGSTQAISLEVNKSILIDLPTDVGEVIASAPQVATVVMRSKTRAIVQGLSGGDTNIFFLDGAGNNIAVLDIKVFQPRSDVGNALEDAITRNIPGSRLHVESVSLDGTTSRIVISGTALSQDDLDKAMQMAAQFAGGADNVANIATVIGNQQVNLKVTVAEVGRDTVKQLGINLNGSITVGSVTLGLENSPATGNVSGVSNSNGATLDISDGPFDLNLEASLRALEQRGALRTLAEPTLAAISGQPAEFRAGGEFPYQTTDADGSVSTAFKEYGVFLNFTPTVKSNGMIQLVVDTSVKEPSSGGGITNRSAKTTVELPAGQTLAIAGMLQDKVRQEVNSLPGVGNIPILGALFRSRDYIRNQTELVILVTPYAAYPSSHLATPVDQVEIAGDAEAVFLGHMEKIYGVDGGGMRGSYSGSVGFVLD